MTNRRKIAESESESEAEFDFDEEEQKVGNHSKEEADDNDDEEEDDDAAESYSQQSQDDSDDEDESFDSDEDDVPLSSLKKKPTTKSKKKKDDDSFISNNDDDDDSDSYNEDDIPLSSLKSKKTPTKSKKTPVKKKKVVAKKAPAKKAKTTKVKKKTTAVKSKKKETPSTNSSTGDGPLLASAELYSKCAKGKLIQAVLCRWWYAMTWPDPKSIPKNPPKHYDALDGFPGVYVCTSGDEVGKLLDYRDKSTSPNFNNFARKSSEDLRTLLFDAIKRQKEALINAEGEGTSTEEDLMKLMRWAQRLNTTKADREAAKVLMAAGLTKLLI